MIQWRKQSSVVMAVSVVVAVLVLSQMAMYEAHLLLGVKLHRNLFDICASLFRSNPLSYYLISVLLNLLVAYTLAIGLFRSIQQFYLIRKFRVRLSMLVHKPLTAQMNDKFRRAKQDIIVVRNDQLLALTMGFRKPRIVLSTGLLDLLDEQELKAVVEHESYHQLNHDAAKIFLLQMISQALWFIPVTKWSYHNYRIISELSADDHAIRTMGNEISLGSALLKMIKLDTSKNEMPVLVHFADVSINYRLSQLVNPRRAIPVRLDSKSLMISVLVLIILMGMILLTGA
ncbi:M56 family metallopeptidase [Cohnella abietis]|uniref:Cell surface protein n=1 Tax=Cohnella abietis TaxID=2507935 RepID=A0A3T1D7U7_9BACL|nr:M56 family metallopeptidase [Cohnella abietis]BBI34156.1 cell surface protein [Cohnella abietis]